MLISWHVLNIPEQVFQLPSCLTRYKSVLKDADGGRIITCGPHQVFTNIENHQDSTEHF